jgi:hypothetical protein
VRFKEIEKGKPPFLVLEFDYRQSSFAADLKTTSSHLNDLRTEFSPGYFSFVGAAGAVLGGEVNSSPEKGDLTYRSPLLLLSWKSVSNFDLTDWTSQHELDHLKSIAMGRKGISSPVYTTIRLERGDVLPSALLGSPYAIENVFDELKVTMGDIIRIRRREITESNAKKILIRIYKSLALANQFSDLIDHFENHRSDMAPMIRNVDDRMWWLSLMWKSNVTFSTHTPLVGVQDSPSLNNAYDIFWPNMFRMRLAAAIAKRILLDLDMQIESVTSLGLRDMPYNKAMDSIYLLTIDGFEKIWPIVRSLDFSDFYEALNIPKNWRAE